MAGPSKAVLEAIARNTHPKVPYPVALAIAERESKFDPNVPEGAAGEIGLFQLLPRTVREELRYLGPLAALKDPNLNTKLATQYLNILFGSTGTWPVAIRAYNGSGPAARAYAAGVLGRLPTWDAFVNANVKFFQSARARIGAGVVVLIGAALAILLLHRRAAE